MELNGQTKRLALYCTTGLQDRVFGKDRPGVLGPFEEFPSLVESVVWALTLYKPPRWKVPRKTLKHKCERACTLQRQ